MNREELRKMDKEQLIDIILELYSQMQALRKNSANSSKPPSSDFGAPKRNQSLRKSSGRESGGQVGHVGTTHAPVENPDTIIVCRPDACSSCKTPLAGVAGLTWEKRQVADIPPLRLFVSEYRSESVVCPNCNLRSMGTFPACVPASFQFGNHVRSLVVYLSVAHHLPFHRLTMILNDLLHLPLSEGAVDTTLSRAETLGKSLYEGIRLFVKQGAWTGSDETGIRVEKDTWWQWVWQNLRASFYAIDRRRGYAVVKEQFGETYTGTLVHDCWSAQNNTHAAHHQLCHAHLLRDLNFCLEIDKSLFAYSIKELLLSSERAQKHIWKEGFDAIVRASVIAGYNKRLAALVAKPAIGRDSQRLQKRFRKHKDSIFHFLTEPDIPFHNNGSEQAIRTAKVKKKVSGCFRSERGARRHAVLLSIIETCKKRGMDVFTSLNKLFDGTLSFQEG